MRWHETLRIAFEAVRTHRMRSLLTVLGIWIGIASVTLTVGLGQGVSQHHRRRPCGGHGQRAWTAAHRVDVRVVEQHDLPGDRDRLRPGGEIAAGPAPPGRFRSA